MDALKTIRMLHRWNVDIYFETEDIHSLHETSEFLLTVICAQAQDESESKSADIKWGLQKSFSDPDSKYYQRRCYGYKHDKNGKLIIDEKEAEVVRLIFRMSREGISLSQISQTLQEQGIPSPRGKAVWSRESLRKILNNEKYFGSVVLQKTFVSDCLSHKQIKNDGQQDKLRLLDAKFTSVLNKDGKIQEYSSNQMSDGERAVLYLAAQVLCVPENKTLIIDEPELHLHRSIMNRLWVALENHRPDCLFIYITHDTQFAAMHGHADKIWIKEFDGQNWKFEKLENSELPEDLLFDILGNRRNVLFVEGEKNSYDTQLYSVLYPDYYVIACGSCTQIIARTKAFRNNP